MSLVFCDSFDTYTDLTTRYDSVFSDSINRSGVARTGVGCLSIDSAAFGPGKTIRQVTDCLIADSYWTNGAGSVFMLGNEGGGPAYQQGQCVGLVLNNDGSLSLQAGPSRGYFTWGTSAAGVFQFSKYNSVALRTTIGAAATMTVWCNGVVVLTLAGIDNRNLHDTSKLYVDAFALFGPPGNAFNAFHDDLYVLDCSDAVNNQYLGALRIYAAVPVADGAVQWTPSAGSANYPNVDAIPPTGAVYNSSATVGQVDQYSHPLPAGVPSNSQLYALQHSQDLEVDSGSRSVTSDMEGTPNAGAVALPSGYALFAWPYDINPITGLSWVAADFPLLAGPAVTA